MPVLVGNPYQFYQLRNGNRVQADSSGNVTVVDSNDVPDLMKAGCSFPPSPTGAAGPTGAGGVTGATGATGP
jgi:hypothetical protein